MTRPIIISIAIEKGGVGKTTTALNLAAGLNKHGKRVLLIDLDQQGNLSDYLGFDFSAVPTINELLYAEVARQPIEPKNFIRTNAEGIDYIPSSKMLSTATTIIGTDNSSQTVLRRILSKPEFAVYDYVIIDCRTALDLLTVNALTASHKLVVPVQAEKFSIDGLASIIDTMNLVRNSQNPNLELGGILITMSVARTTMSREVEALLRDNFGAKVFRTVIPRLSEAARSTAEQCSLVQTKNSRLGGKYLEVVEELING